ncbi:sigma-54-dependent Fis family transcriptional regulator [Clostridium rectalis]|uniref:sigma-54-dependent Fis family transcriptional regulator n=1 Tax=Clostridium rectalis TaxID=2040295 RepID=UPI000F6301AD|nr:sigma 54-interacting transcriptional regulator [Clostridium rectalis]
MIDKIQNYLQEIAETLKAIVDIDITIMNKNLKRIAGTGKLKEKIGSQGPRNSVFEKCILTGKSYFITNPVNCRECLNCEINRNCTEKAEVCFPIIIDGKVEGLIGMIAFSEKQKEIFLKKQESYKDFDKRMSELISSKIKENAFLNRLKYKSMELLTVIDSVDEGIIIIDKNNIILSVNKYIKNRLKRTDIVGKNINNLLSKIAIDKFTKTCYVLDDEEVNITIDRNKYRFLMSMVPIHLEGEIESAVITLKDFNKLQRSVFKISESGDKFTFNDMIGKSTSFLQVKNQAKHIAKSNAAVLLLGESGTGKELFARAIHAESNKRDEIFMPINCGAIPENLMESELFGYEKGAFTGANVSGKIGKFEIGKNGTVFLDEIGDLPLHLQVKLLRVLEEKEIIRVGGITPIKMHCRIIAATNKNLLDMVKKGQFREDLFYRLNVIPIHIPPLRDRDIDVLNLAYYFLQRYNGIYDKNIEGFTKDAEEILVGYSFPGNVRELQNIIEYAINFAQNSLIDKSLISKRMSNRNKNIDTNMTLKELVSQFEKEVINKFIKQYGSSTESKKIIAKKLGIGTATLYRKIDD